MRQYGFRSKSSTSSCVIDLIDYVHGELDKGNYVTSVFLNLSKAFDSVNLDILLNKLENCGVRGVPLNLFECYLKNRRQFVDISGSCSSYDTILRGVSQGSGLGPLLFLVYVNDLADVLTRKGISLC